MSCATQTLSVNLNPPPVSIDFTSKPSATVTTATVSLTYASVSAPANGHVVATLTIHEKVDKVQVLNGLPGGFSVSIDSPLTTVPDVTETPRAIANNEIHAAGLVPKFTGAGGPNAWVFSQSPVGGHVVAKGSTVTMLLRNGPLP